MEGTPDYLIQGVNMASGNKNVPGMFLQFKEEPCEEAKLLQGKKIEKVIWIIANHYSGGAPVLRIVLEDGTFLDVDHEGDCSSHLVVDPYDPAEKHVPHVE